jgi:hypothetical protein
MERRRAIILIALAAFLSCLLPLYRLNLAEFEYPNNIDFSTDSLFENSSWAFIPHLFLGSIKKRTSKNVAAYKHSNSKTKVNNKGKIAIFTGRSANKNLAIFEILDANGPLPISELQKQLNKIDGLEITYYASLNKRIHALEKGGYIAQTGQAAASPKGFRASLYEARAKFYLAQFLNSSSREEILSQMTETHAVIILAELVKVSLQASKK